MIEIRDLSFRYAKTEPQVLNGLSLSLEKGTIGVLLGRNGCGKSTLCKILLGLLRPDSGTVILDGEDLLRLPPKKRAAKIAYVPQELSFGALSVYECVLMGRISRFGILPKAEDDRAVRSAISEMGLLGFEDRNAELLSGGEKQKVAIARALAEEPELLLFDEPTGNLDMANERAFLETAKRLSEEKGITVLSVLHDLNRAMEFGNRFFFLKDGCIAHTGGAEIFTPENIYEVFETNVRIETVGGRRIILEV